ncbi:metallophosphoesterase family protein [Haloquadratum walsbyi]|jgi:phosphoesterase, MJ0936 family|uniref:Phosphoesterase n=1 Tax=Haloquadratum walsbyi J07HQW2 TaxID=1238425 RepID=U1N0G6_9EURY|nr:metallophosphoesterase family protein [Haloquadratum walsbyi]ERG96289.1 MAG: phosphoesterase, MJ0936 family [Haloquadratum walsbyi J07HQW2]
MRIGCCSDTHDNLRLARRAVETFIAADVDMIIHCGDIVSPFTASIFDTEIPFHAIRGNNDGEWAVESTIEDFENGSGTYHGESVHLSFETTENNSNSEIDIAVYHGTSEHLVDALLECGQYDYVLRGHTHNQTVEMSDSSVHVNPGGLPISGADDAYHVAIIDTDHTVSTDAVTVHTINNNSD